MPAGRYLGGEGGKEEKEGAIVGLTGGHQNPPRHTRPCASVSLFYLASTTGIDDESEHRQRGLWNTLWNGTAAAVNVGSWQRALVTNHHARYNYSSSRPAGSEQQPYCPPPTAHHFVATFTTQVHHQQQLIILLATTIVFLSNLRSSLHTSRQHSTHHFLSFEPCPTLRAPSNNSTGTHG
jgi:hypothetical protein